jgi:hypothetical protein
MPDGRGQLRRVQLRRAVEHARLDRVQIAVEDQDAAIGGIAAGGERDGQHHGDQSARQPAPRALRRRRSGGPVSLGKIHVGGAHPSSSQARRDAI